MKDLYTKEQIRSLREQVHADILQFFAKYSVTKAEVARRLNIGYNHFMNFLADPHYYMATKKLESIAAFLESVKEHNEER